MTRRRTGIARIKRFVAVFLLISLLNQVAAPTVAWALTSGPTSPEATSFEPVDTTDMVNLATGDLVYTIPLLEVPGPEGGYPLSLSYHAGIQPNEDASWVGLGWTLNPGAINRSVNGYPDDWYGAESSRRDFWEGGTSTGSRVGVNVPILGNAASLSLGLSFSNDTYQGRGFGWDLGIAGGIPNTPFTAGVGIGMSTSGKFQGQASLGGRAGNFSAGLGITTSGDTFAFGSASVGPGDNKSGYGIGLNLSTDFESINAGFMLTYSSSSMGTDAKTSSKVSTSALAGFSASTQNSRAGSLSTKTSSTSINLFVASYSRTKMRYWSNEREESFMYGSLHPNWMSYIEIPEENAYDSYTLQDEDKSIIDAADPNQQMGGSFPAYDLYQVTAQGLGGTMRPYRFKGEALQQNRWEKTRPNSITPTVKYIANSSATAYPDFRFENDFSNNYIQSYPDFPAVGSELIFYDPPSSGPQFDDSEWMNGISGNKLAGSRHIDYFVTNTDGTVPVYGNKQFIAPFVNGGLTRRAHTSQANRATHIAGFAITSETGVTYHYNLPAYSYDEEMYQELVNKADGLK
uniref:hypothetical protein n=1 Tax=Arcticibacter sp. TaxID=1872630 RepID=UPI003890D9A2